jgi:hypothetical protein
VGQEGLNLFMNKKLKHLTSILTGKRAQVSLRFTLFLGLMFIAISGLAGCSVPEYLNSTIANAVGDKRVQGRQPRTIKGQVYTCNVRSVKRLGPSGTMEENSNSNVLLASNSENFIFDETTGILSGDGFSPLKMSVLQIGTNENSTIGYSTYKGDASSGIAVLRIQKWEVGLPFLFLDSAILWTGSCNTK